jgi:hypothetical protein
MSTFDYKQKRFWYHISTKLKKRGEFCLQPWGREDSENRDPEEPDGIRIPVAPSLEQCLTALNIYPNHTYQIYRTKEEMSVTSPKGIFDSKVTNEGWILNPTIFVRVGSLNMTWLKDDENIGSIFDACCVGKVRFSRFALKKWLAHDVHRYVNYSKNYDHAELF